MSNTNMSRTNRLNQSKETTKSRTNETPVDVQVESDMEQNKEAATSDLGQDKTPGSTVAQAPATNTTNVTRSQRKRKPTMKAEHKSKKQAFAKAPAPARSPVVIPAKTVTIEDVTTGILQCTKNMIRLAEDYQKFVNTWMDPDDGGYVERAQEDLKKVQKMVKKRRPKLDGGRARKKARLEPMTDDADGDQADSDKLDGGKHDGGTVDGSKGKLLYTIIGRCRIPPLPSKKKKGTKALGGKE
jgi:hypothetical protein